MTDNDHSLNLGGWLGEMYQRRIENGQDIIGFIDDYNNDRGTGKTILTLLIADYMDRTDEGLTTDKCFIDSDELVRAYTESPPGSALVLDEAEVGADKYQAGSKSNRALRKIVSMGRIEEKYVFFNMPNIHFIDRDLKSLGTVWISVEALGRARVHRLGYNKYRAEERTPLKHRITWSDIKDRRLRNIYNELTEEKRRHMAGEEGGMNLISADEAEKIAEKRAKEQLMEQRNEWIKKLCEQDDLTQGDIAEVVGVTRQRVSQIKRGEA